MLVTNGAAGVVQKYAYDAYGNNYEGSFAGSNNIGYNSKKYDGGTGWYDYGFRDYDSRTGRFTIVDPIRDGMNWYAYCGGDPINFTDPDGRIQRKADQSVVFYPNSDLHSEIGNSGKEIMVQWGTIKANDSSDIEIRINSSQDSPYENFNCHGYTFTNGLGWVQPDQVDSLIRGDGYIEQDFPSPGSIFVQIDSNGNAFHSGKIQSVNENEKTITVKEALGGMFFIGEDGKLRKTREFTYKLSEMGNVKFYKNEGDCRID